MPFDPNTLTKKFEDLFAKMDAQAAAQLAQTLFITNYDPDNYANLYDVWTNINDLRYLYRDPDDAFTPYYASFKAHLAAIRAQLISALADPPVSAADLLFSINQKLDGVINGNQELITVMTDALNQLITSNSTLAGLLIATGTGGGGSNSLIGLLNRQLLLADNCGCNSPNYEPQDCTAPYRSYGQASRQFVESGPYSTLALFDPATVPSGIEVTDDLATGNTTLRLSDPTQWQMYVSSDQPAWANYPGGNPEYRTNEWITPPFDIESPYIVAVPLGSSVKVTFCPVGGFINPACIYMTGSYTDSLNRNVAQWADGPGVLDGATGLLDPAYFNDWWVEATGTDQLSIVLSNTFFYDFSSNTPYNIGFLPDTFYVLCNNGGAISNARLCPEESEL